MEQARLHNENEHLGETLSDDIPQLSIVALNEECINCGALTFLVKYGRTVLITVKFNWPMLNIPRR